MQAAWVSTVDTPSVAELGDWPLFGEGGGVSGDGGTLVQFDSDGTAPISGVFRERCDILDGLGWHNY